MVKQTAGQEFLLSTIINFEHFYHTRTAILLSSAICLEQHYTRTAVGRR